MESGSSTSANHGAPNHSTRDVVLFPSMDEVHSNKFLLLNNGNISLSYDVEYCDWQVTSYYNDHRKNAGNENLYFGYYVWFFRIVT